MEVAYSTRTVETMIKTPIAIQGVEGSYHHIAARKYFGQDISLVKCNRFEELFRELEAGNAKFAVMAIENTVAGTILPNYALLRESNYRIIGEVYLPIEHQLMCIKGQTLEQMTEVRSHPMALLQCRSFFKAHPKMQLVEQVDTALSAKELQQNPKAGVAVVASKLAAELFDLQILKSSVDDNKRNFTRFLVLEETTGFNIENPLSNKASVCFHLGHRVGSLAGILAFIAGHRLNLTKIQSLPLVGKEWEYFFHLDMEFDNYDNFLIAMETLSNLTTDLKILGEYKKGERP